MSQLPPLGRVTENMLFPGRSGTDPYAGAAAFEETAEDDIITLSFRPLEVAIDFGDDETIAVREADSSAANYVQSADVSIVSDVVDFDLLDAQSIRAEAQAFARAHPAA